MNRIGPDVLGFLYREHGPALVLFARQWGSGAEDLVHDAFLTLARQDRLPEPALPWLYRVVRHRAIALARSASRRQRRETAAAPGEAWFAPSDDRLEADEAASALAGLPIERREVVVARIWGGLTFEEIARLVGCSLATAHRRYQTGLAELKARLEDPCPRSPTSRTAT